MTGPRQPRLDLIVEAVGRAAQLRELLFALDLAPARHEVRRAITESRRRAESLSSALLRALEGETQAVQVLAERDRETQAWIDRTLDKLGPLSDEQYAAMARIVLRSRENERNANPREGERAGP